MKKTFSAGFCAIILSLTGLTGCFSNSATTYPLTQSTPSPSPDTDSTTSKTRFQISTVNITAGSGSTFMSTVFFDRDRSSPINASVAEFCNRTSGTSQSSAKPCRCLYTWDEINETTGTQIPIKRSVHTELTDIQPQQVKCTAPSVYAKEIDSNTIVYISVVPVGANPEASRITMSPYRYTKQGQAQSGSFQDAQGRAFDNVYRYACHDQYKRGMEVKSFVDKSMKNQKTNQVANVALATKFCIAGADGAPPSGCEGMTGGDYSAQAYFYNLYIRNTDRGAINVENKRYRCPKVQEALHGDGSFGSANDFYPMDTSFALGLNPSTDFPVGVEAYSKLSLGAGDPGSKSSACYGADAGDAKDASSLVNGCIGFAAKPNTNGTCPNFTDATGRIRQTYRLRRFIAMYPPLFDSGGKLLNGAQPSDTIYVLDRPVTANLAEASDQPYTMRGPKPCPQAFFDHKKVTVTESEPPRYLGTNSPFWNYTNVDGIEFPNKDINSSNGASCSAAIPLLNDDKTIFSIGTLHSTNPALKRLYVRPIRSWAPHYEEDTDFLACAPQASPLVDPPLHFARDPSTGNVSWCAEAYPTQNSLVNKLDTHSVPGKVVNYTSHVAKNTLGGACTATTDPLKLPANYGNATAPSGSNQCSTVLDSDPDWVAKHPADFLRDRVSHANNLPGLSSCYNNGKYEAVGDTCDYCAHQTCDRTLLSATDGGWAKYPLLADAKSVEEALINDTTYGCIVTYDAGGGKTGRKSPSNGCCGVTVKVESGASSTTASTAHLEPGPDGSLCKQPEY